MRAPRIRGVVRGGSSRGDVRLRVIGVVVSLVVTAAVVRWALHQHAPEFSSSPADLAALVGASALYLLTTAVRGERWYQLLRPQSERVSRRDCSEIITVGYMGNNVLPARGGDVMRVYLLANRAELGKRTVIGSLITERLLDLVCLAAIFVLLAYAVLRDVSRPTGWSLAATVAAIVVLVAGGIGAVLVTRRLGLFARARDFARPMLVSLRALSLRAALLLGGLTLVIWALEAATYLVVGQAVGFHMNPLEALYLVALTGLFVTIPAGPGNLGTFDAGILLGMRSLGAGSGTPVSYLLMLRFVLFVPVTVLGVVLLVLRHGGWSRLRAARMASVGAVEA